MEAVILNLVVSLFAIIDPLAAIPLFITLFGKMEPQRQKKAAMEASMAALTLLMLFSIFGALLLKALDISINAFMIAGGLLLLKLSMDFLEGELPASRRVEHDMSDSIVPIATPLLAGPGAISTVIYFAYAYGLPPTIISIFIAMGISWLCLYNSSRITGLLGKNGLKVTVRILGLITAAIAINMMVRALSAWGIIRA